MDDSLVERRWDAGWARRRLRCPAKGHGGEGGGGGGVLRAAWAAIECAASAPSSLLARRHSPPGLRRAALRDKRVLELAASWRSAATQAWNATASARGKWTTALQRRHFAALHRRVAS